MRIILRYDCYAGTRGSVLDVDPATARKLTRAGWAYPAALGVDPAAHAPERQAPAPETTDAPPVAATRRTRKRV